MKRYIYVSMIILSTGMLMTACQKKNDQALKKEIIPEPSVTDSTMLSVSDELDSAAMARESFDKLMTKPASDALEMMDGFERSGFEIEQGSLVPLFFMAQVEKSNAEANDALFLAYTAFQKKIADAAYDKLESDPELNNEVQGLAIEGADYSQRAKEYQALMKNNGLRREDEEGMVSFYPSIGYAFSFFGKHMTKPMQEYYGQIVKEEKEGLMADAGLVISPKNLASRVGFRSRFALKYPNHNLTAQDGAASKEYRTLLSLLMMGLDNTPAFSLGEKPTMNQDFKEAITYSAENYGDTPFGELMVQYQALLKEEGYLQTETVKQFVIGKLK